MAFYTKICEKKFTWSRQKRQFESVDQSQSRARTRDIRRTGYDRFEPVRRPITNEHGGIKEARFRRLRIDKELKKNDDKKKRKKKNNYDNDVEEEAIVIIDFIAPLK